MFSCYFSLYAFSLFFLSLLFISFQLFLYLFPILLIYNDFSFFTVTLSPRAWKSLFIGVPSVAEAFLPTPYCHLTATRLPSACRHTIPLRHIFPAGYHIFHNLIIPIPPNFLSSYSLFSITLLSPFHQFSFSFSSPPCSPIDFLILARQTASPL